MSPWIGYTAFLKPLLLFDELQTLVQGRTARWPRSRPRWTSSRQALGTDFGFFRYLNGELGNLAFQLIPASANRISGFGSRFCEKVPAG